MRQCSVKGCVRRHAAHGLCAAHAERLRRTGKVGGPEIGPSTRGRTLAERLWDRVARGGSNDCWEWTAHRLPKGYGVFGPGVVAHRVAWEVTHGPIPRGLFVLHACDNPPCCNPSHLRLGTAQDNVDDMMAKGRSRWQ